MNHLKEIFCSRQLNELFISFFLRSLSFALVGLFIPVYLLQAGYGIFHIALFFLISFSTSGILMPFTFKLNHYIGVRKTIALGTTLNVFYLYFLNSLSITGPAFYFLPFLAGLSEGIFWSGYHPEYSRSAIRSKEAGGLSVLKIIIIVSSIIGPFIGGLTIKHLSFNVLFIIAALLMLSAVIPLFASKDHKAPLNKLTVKNIMNAGTKRELIAYQVDGSRVIMTLIFWPTFIYLTLKDVVSMGAIYSASALAMIFVMVYLGRVSDKNPKKVFKVGIGIFSPLWIVRLFVFSPIGIFAVNFLSDVAQSAKELTFGKHVYQRAKKVVNSIDYFTFREINLFIGRVIILAIAMIILNLEWLFVVTAIISLGYLVLLKEMSD
ncbi:MAG: MFS transporter [archaeon]